VNGKLIPYVFAALITAALGLGGWSLNTTISNREAIAVIRKDLEGLREMDRTAGLEAKMDKMSENLNDLRVEQVKLRQTVEDYLQKK